MQHTLFHTSDNLLPYDGDVCLFSRFFSKTESDRLFSDLLKDVPWKQEPITLFGKTVMQPRLTAWYADEGVSYGYSGLKLQNFPWNKVLMEIKKRVEEKTGFTFNSALLNQYRDGTDSMGWHRDNERELGPEPVIASLSFGQERRFQLRNYHHKKDLRSIALQHGSLLLMQGATQHHWEHRVPKLQGIAGTRINITFRRVM